MQLSLEQETEAEPFESALRNENKSKSILGEEPWKGRGSGRVLQQQVSLSGLMRSVWGPPGSLGGILGGKRGPRCCV